MIPMLHGCGDVIQPPFSVELVLPAVPMLAGAPANHQSEVYHQPVSRLECPPACLHAHESAAPPMLLLCRFQSLISEGYIRGMRHNVNETKSLARG